MYARILVGVDGSATSTRALKEAVLLAKEQHARLWVVHVIEDAYAYFALDGGVDIEYVASAWRQAGQVTLDRAVAEARAEGLEPECVLIENDGQRISDVLRDEATRWSADLIVLGTHGRHGLEHLLLGSVAEGVVRTTTVPVLLVRGQ